MKAPFCEVLVVGKTLLMAYGIWMSLEALYKRTIQIFGTVHSEQ